MTHDLSKEELPNDIEQHEIALPGESSISMTIRSRYQSRKDWILAGFGSDGYMDRLAELLEADKVAATWIVWPIFRRGEMTGSRRDELQMLLIPKDLLPKSEFIGLLRKCGIVPGSEMVDHDVFTLSEDYRIALLNAVQAIMDMSACHDN